jgi:predicted SAM-dependent methyltransferase
MKGIIRDWVKKVGYDIVRVDDGFDVAKYKRLYPEKSIRERRFYNIGAGSFRHPCWTNIDNGSEWYGNVFGIDDNGIDHDLLGREPLPVDENSAELAYTSHTIEHLDDESVQHMFNECRRILKPGGTLRVTCPDIDLEYAAWKNNDREFFFWYDDPVNNRNLEVRMLAKPFKDASLTQLFIEEFATHASELVLDGAEPRISDEEFKRIFEEMPYEEALDHCVSRCSVELQRKYPFRHMNWFNEKKLIRMLNASGFKDIQPSRYRQSKVAVLRNHRFFDNTLPMLSLYIEAVK